MGTVHAGVFTVVADPSDLGYWCYNQFYPHDCGYDFSRFPTYVGTSKYYYPQGTVIAYRVSGQILPTKQAAEAYLQIKPTGVQRICMKCHHPSAQTLELFKKSYCMDCLRLQVINNELFFREGDERKEWSAQMICDVLEALYYYQPEQCRRDLSNCLPLPHNTFLCYGKVERLGQGGGWYPNAPAHIAGHGNKCEEEGCPNGHTLCKSCANDLYLCPVCRAFIPFEFPKQDFPCENHCLSFTVPCHTCGRVSQHRKRV